MLPLQEQHCHALGQRSLLCSGSLGWNPVLTKQLNLRRLRLGAGALVTAAVHQPWACVPVSLPPQPRGARAAHTGRPRLAALVTAQALSARSGGGDDGMPAALQPGPQSMVQLMGAWGKLSRLIQQQAALWQQQPSGSATASAPSHQPTALILNALKLAVGCLRDAPARRDGRTPVERALDLAAQLAGLCSSGLPLDAACIAAGIVAEAVELRRLHIRVVDAKLGADVAALVHDILQVRSTPQMVQLHDDEASSSVREWCLAAFDVRSTVIEIVARWVNLQHLGQLPMYEQQLVALEALQVFAPLGHALGVGPISAQMEDMCFQVLFPQSYAHTAQWMHAMSEHNQQLLQACEQQLQDIIAGDAHFAQLAAGFEVRARTKSLFSVMKKLLWLSDVARGGRRQEDIFDLMGLRVVILPRADLPDAAAEAAAVQACYRVQELAESVWPKLVERCKDYIATPKPNGYQSLHVAFKLDQPAAPAASAEEHASRKHSGAAASSSGSSSSSSSSSGGSSSSSSISSAGSSWGQLGPPVSHLELQIRTQRMDAAAEQGEAAHTAYKGGLDSRQARQLTAWTHELQQRSVQRRHLLELAVSQQAILPGFIQPLALAEPSNSSTATSSSGSNSSSSSDSLLPAVAEGDDQLSAASSLFRHLDLDGDGRLSVEELASLMEELGVPHSRAGASTMLALLDSNGDSRVSLEEFIDFFRSAGPWQQLVQQQVQQQQKQQQQRQQPQKQKLLPAAGGFRPSGASASSGASSADGKDSSSSRGSSGSSTNWQAVFPAALAAPRTLPPQQQPGHQVALATAQQQSFSTFGRSAQRWPHSSSEPSADGHVYGGSSSSGSSRGLGSPALCLDAQQPWAGDTRHNSRGGAVVMAGRLVLASALNGSGGDEGANADPDTSSSNSNSSSSSSSSRAPDGEDLLDGAAGSDSRAGAAEDEATAERVRSGLFASSSSGSGGGGKGARGRIDRLRPLVAPAEASLPPDGPPMLRAPRSLRRPVRSANGAWSDDGMSSGEEDGASNMPSIPGSIPTLVLVPVGEAPLLDRQGQSLQDGIPVPALGPLVVSNSARVFSNSDALFEHSTDGYERLCVRLELVTEQNSGTTSLLLWNRSRYVRARRQQSAVQVNGEAVLPHTPARELQPGDVVVLGPEPHARAGFRVQVVKDGQRLSPVAIALARYCPQSPGSNTSSRSSRGGMAHTELAPGLDAAAQAPSAPLSDAEAAELEADAATAEARAMQRVYNLARTDPVAAEQRLAQLLCAEPDAAAAWFVWAQLAAARRRYWMARDLYRAAHHCCNAMLLRARAELVAANAARVTHQVGRLVQVLNTWATMEWDQHNFGSARRLWRAAANTALRQARKAAAASSAIVFHCWASAEYERDNVRNARIVISEALRKCHNDAPVLMLAACIHYKAGELEAAQALFRRAYTLDRSDKKLYMVWPKLEGQLGNDERARALFARGLARHPNSSKIMNVYAVFEASRGNIDAARALHTRALSLDPHSATTMHNRVSWAALEAEAGDVDAARTILREGLDRHPDFPAALVVLGSIERRAGNLDLAEAYVRRAQKSANAFEPAVIQELQLIYDARGEPALAANLARHLFNTNSMAQLKRSGAWASEAWEAYYDATRHPKQRRVIRAAQRRKQELGLIRPPPDQGSDWNQGSGQYSGAEGWQAAGLEPQQQQQQQQQWLQQDEEQQDVDLPFAPEDAGFGEDDDGDGRSAAIINGHSGGANGTPYVSWVERGR